MDNMLSKRLDGLANLCIEIFNETPIPLHRPVFENREKQYLTECVDSNFVSSVGERVNEFENKVQLFTGASFAIAVCNGTSALHLALRVAGVSQGDEVITQALTFVATCNAASYLGARPIFLDIDPETLSLCPVSLRSWLEKNTKKSERGLINRNTGAQISACVPMHTFGLPARINEISSICEEFGVVLVEDAAESLGSYFAHQHTGTFGALATLSFNGNKIITTGGGGMVLTNDPDLAGYAKHLSTTAKQPHKWEFFHDEVGFNYRMPNLNAALGCAQMEVLPEMLKIKAEVSGKYRDYCNENNVTFVDAIKGSVSNYWLNAVMLKDRMERNQFLECTNSMDIMTRPVWALMNELPMFSDCEHDGLAVSRNVADRLVNLPSSVPQSEFHRITS